MAVAVVVFIVATDVTTSLESDDVEAEVWVSTSEARRPPNKFSLLSALMRWTLAVEPSAEVELARSNSAAVMVTS